MLNPSFPVKIPAFQFYPADWRKDPSVQALSYHERGVWFEILCIMHESSERGKLLLNGKPMPLEVLSRLLGLDKQGLSKTLDAIIEMGVARKDENGVIFSKRMVKDEEIRRIRHEAGLKGGNPALLKQKVKHQVKGVVQQPNNQTSEDEDEDEVEDEALGLEGESEGADSASAILAHLNNRAGRMFRDTAQNLKLIKARLREVGDDVDGVKQMIERQCARWLGTDQEEYLRPETLFGKQKFGGYYDSRNVPVPGLRKLGATDADHERGF